MGVLMLTQELMQGNDTLYKCDKESLKLADLEKMNGFIKRFPEVRQKIAEIGRYEFDHKLTQEEQT